MLIATGGLVGVLSSTTVNPNAEADFGPDPRLPFADIG